MFVTIDSPRGLGGAIMSVVDPFTVSGRYHKFISAHLTSFWIDVKFGGGGPVVRATLTSSSTWTCTGSTLPSVMGTDQFVVTATTRGFYDIPADREFNIPIDPVSDTVTLVKSDFAWPVLTIAPVAADINATQLPHPFVLSGSATDTDSRIRLVECALDTGPFQPIASAAGPWQTAFSLTPGLHRFDVRAFDASNHLAEQVLFTFVHPPTPFPDPQTESITSWTRLEPHCRDADLGSSVAARLFDPLWMLTRQWQIGEFQGIDAGSPVHARVRATNAKLSRIHLGFLPDGTSAPATPYDAATMPLEALVERRRMRPVDPTDPTLLSTAIEAGLHCLRLLETRALAKYRAAFVAAFALQPLPAAVRDTADQRTLRFAATMTGRALDARRLALALRAANGPTQVVGDPALQVVPADAAKVRQALVDWLAWYDALFTEPAPNDVDPWDQSRLEYAVTVAGAFSNQQTSQVNLTASEYVDGRLDWSSFDADLGVSLGSQADNRFTAIVETTVPAPVTFPGAPAVRFWEIEDAKVAYGLVPVGPTDLAHLLLIEYASSYGNDWYTVPLRIPVGSMTRVDSLVVTDSFGVRTLLAPINTGQPYSHFAMWQQSILRRPGQSWGSGVASNVFFLPPGLGKAVESAPLESVLLMRDEMANVAWAIEQTIESPVEQPVAWAAGTPTTAATALAPPVTGPSLQYVLSTTVPENWIPLLPVQTTVGGLTVHRLKRGAVLRPDAQQIVHVARGEVLRSAGQLLLYDADVPREGARVTRGRRMARWTDGTTWVWNAFRKGVGRGEGSSGLTFDGLVDRSGGGG